MRPVYELQANLEVGSGFEPRMCITLTHTFLVVCVSITHIRGLNRLRQLEPTTGVARGKFELSRPVETQNPLTQLAYNVFIT